MNSFSARRSLAVGVVALVGSASLPATSEAAVARRAGGSGYSGTLSNNPAIRRQQLTCDPPPSDGSTSVEYDPRVSSLVAYQFGPGYSLRGAPGTPPGLVEVREGQTTRLLNIDTFLSPNRPPNLVETGYVQFAFALDPAEGPPGRLQPPAGFTTVARNPGVTEPDGVDTHALQFELLGGLPLDTIGQYRVFAAEANTRSGNAADGLRGEDMTGVFSLGPGQLSAVTIAAPFPEPSSLAVMGMAAAGLLKRRRRK